MISSNPMAAARLSQWPAAREPDFGAKHLPVRIGAAEEQFPESSGRQIKGGCLMSLHAHDVEDEGRQPESRESSPIS